MVIKVDIVINDLFCFLKTWNGIGSQGFILQVPEEIFHGRIVPADAAADLEGVMTQAC